jgi:hypothetical protein
VAALGLHPRAISTHSGAGIQPRLATVVIGGILSSTVLGLIVLPIMLRLLRRVAPEGPGIERAFAQFPREKACDVDVTKVWFRRNQPLTPVRYGRPRSRIEEIRIEVGLS